MHGASDCHGGERRLRIVLFITVSFLLAEFAAGLVAHSLALLSDAGHMLVDSSALALALVAAHQARRPPDRKRTYGYRRFEVLAGLGNGVLLGCMAVGILWEAWRRFGDPPEVRAGLMLVVALGGLFINLAGMWLLHRDRDTNLNLRAAFLHLVGDTLGSLGAISAALIIRFTGWNQADALVSVFIASLILWGSVRLVRESMHYLLEGAPRHIQVVDVHGCLAGIPGVIDVHDLHLWRISSGQDILTAHVVVEDLARWKETLAAADARLRERFGLVHTTIQMEGREVLGNPEHQDRICNGAV